LQRVKFAMTYRVLPTTIENLNSGNFAVEGESRSFSGLSEALAWGARSRTPAVVLVEESPGRALALNSAEEAARSVA